MCWHVRDTLNISFGGAVADSSVGKIIFLGSARVLNI